MRLTLVELLRMTGIHAGFGGGSTPACLPDETVAAAAEGALDAGSRAAVMDHLASCARCRAAVASIARLLADPAVARAADRARSVPQRWIGVAIPGVAAAVILLTVVPALLRTPGPRHRAPAPAAADRPAPLHPVGTVATVARLVWTGTPGADRYRVALFDAAGSVLYEAATADTAIAIPDSVTLVPGRRYLWRVEARVGFDRWMSSGLIDVEVAGRGGT